MNTDPSRNDNQLRVYSGATEHDARSAYEAEFAQLQADGWIPVHEQWTGRTLLVTLAPRRRRRRSDAPQRDLVLAGGNARRAAPLALAAVVLLIVIIAAFLIVYASYH